MVMHVIVSSIFRMTKDLVLVLCLRYSKKKLELVYYQPTLVCKMLDLYYIHSIQMKRRSASSINYNKTCCVTLKDYIIWQINTSIYLRPYFMFIPQMCKLVKTRNYK